MESVKELRKQLEATADPDEFDRLAVEVARAEKAASLEAARKRQAEEQAAEELHQAEEARKAAALARLEELAAELPAHDQAVADALQHFAEAYQRRQANRAEEDALLNSLGRGHIQQTAFDEGVTVLCGRYFDHLHQLQKHGREYPGLPKFPPAQSLYQHTLSIGRDGIAKRK